MIEITELIEIPPNPRSHIPYFRLCFIFIVKK